MPSSPQPLLEGLNVPIPNPGPTTLLELRTNLVNRYGLTAMVGVTGGALDYTIDQGADSLINRGMKKILMMNPWLASKAVNVPFTLPISQYWTTVDNLREPRRIWRLSTDGTHYIPLHQHSIEWMNDRLGVLGTHSPGAPHFWAFKEGFMPPSTPATGVGNLFFWPVPDAAYSMVVSGLMHLDVLVNDTDSNYLTWQWGDVVIDMAYYMYLRDCSDFRKAEAHLAMCNADLMQPTIDHFDITVDELAGNDGLLEIDNGHYW